jgi:hypothetical protein
MHTNLFSIYKLIILDFSVRWKPRWKAGLHDKTNKELMQKLVAYTNFT